MMPQPKEPAAPVGPDAVLRALADPHRRQILRLVQHGELPAGQIAANFTLTQQAVSQHLTVLKRAGLLAERREGARRLDPLRAESLQPLRDLLEESWPDALARLKQSVERSHPRTGGEDRSDQPERAHRRAPEVVFPYFTNPRLLVTWIGERADPHARPGGTFALDFGGARRPWHLRRGRAPAPRRVHLGDPRARRAAARSSTVEVALVADGDDTIVNLTHRDLPPGRGPLPPCGVGTLHGRARHHRRATDGRRPRRGRGGAVVACGLLRSRGRRRP